MIVETANAVCLKAGIGSSGNPVIPVTGRVRQHLGIDRADYDAFVSHLKEQRSQIEEFLGHMH